MSFPASTTNRNTSVNEFIIEAAHLMLTSQEVATFVIHSHLAKIGMSHRLTLSVLSSVVAQSLRIQAARKKLYV